MNMKPVSPVLLDQPDAQPYEVKVAEHQPEYGTLPALLVAGEAQHARYVDSLRESDYTISRWELTDEEVEKIVKSRCLYFYQWNYRRQCRQC
jgi:hypothetical protein